LNKLVLPHVTDPAQAAMLDEADIESWLRLFDCLDATLASAGGPEALRIFRALGPRRFAYAHRRLLRERQRLAIEIEGIGICPAEGRTLPSSRAPGEKALDTDYENLAEAFARCAPIAQRLGKPALKQWLLGRARMHRQHAMFLVT
jgi:hypothetical protein